MTETISHSELKPYSSDIKMYPLHLWVEKNLSKVAQFLNYKHEIWHTYILHVFLSAVNDGITCGI